MELRQGQRVFVEGDAPMICTADYTAMVSPWATGVDEPDPDDEQGRGTNKDAGHSRRWTYEFSCKACENLRQISDPTKHRNGLYCIPVIKEVDRRPANWSPFNPDGTLKPDDTHTIHADEYDRHIRCSSFKARQGGGTRGPKTELRDLKG